MRKLFLLVASVISMFFQLACEEDSQLPPVSWQGDWIRFATTAEKLPCGKTLEKLDEAVLRAQELLNRPLTDNKKITYYWLPEPDSKLSPCGDAHSCAIGLTIYSEVLDMHHEIIHSLTSGDEHLRHHRCFEEGFADAFSLSQIRRSLSEDQDDLLEAFITPPTVYDSISVPFNCAHFVRYLLEKEGLEITNELFDRSKTSSTVQQMDNIFVELTGTGLESQIYAWSTDAPECYQAMALCEYMEELLPSDQSNTRWNKTIHFSCDSGDTIRQSKSWELLADYIIDVKTPGEYNVSITSSTAESGNSYSQVYLEKCGECPEFFETNLAEEQITTLNLDAEKYRLRISEHSNNFEQAETINASIEIDISLKE